MGAGDATRASLTYKKLARHGSPTWQQKFRFGQLLEGSNKKLAVGTYEAALSDLGKLGKKKEAAEILDRIVALEPTQANLLRVAELASELGNRKVAASAFQRVAQLAAAEGGDAAQWYERAYQEDASDQGIALAYGKSLLAQGQVGAAIFILEPQMNSGEVTPALRETYADALVAAGRYAEAEPLVWQLFEPNPARVQQVIGLIGKFAGRRAGRCGGGAGAQAGTISAAARGAAAVHRHHGRHHGGAPGVAADAGIPERTV